MTGSYPTPASDRFLGVGSPGLRRVIFGLFLTLEFVYIAWRVAFSLSGAPSVYAWLLVAAEVYVILHATWFYALLGPKRARQEPPAPILGLEVDVFITTYNEDIDLVRTTAIAARDMDYPHRTWVLDDGRRPAMKAMAESIGVNYITRPSNEHYKAGNLNNALSQTAGDLVMVLDADHIPRRQFLTRLVGYFEDPEVGLVQTPQIYYNVGSYQHRTSMSKGLLWHEGRIFQHRIMAGAERLGCAFFIGTGGLLRRSALEAVGGFATGSVTEDIYTSMRLHAKGYRSVFVDEPLGFMQAPQSPHAYASQRLRWAQGGLQILRRENPLFKKGLTVLQRIGYFYALSHSLNCYPNLLFYLVPPLYLLFGLNPINASPEIVIPMIMGHIGVNLVVYRLLAAPDGRVMESGFFKFVNLPIHVRASLRLLFPEGLAFKVTPKGRQATVPPSMWLPAVALITVSVLSIAFGLQRVILGELGIWVAVLSLFFSGLFVGSGLFVLRRAFGIEVENEVMYVPLNVDTLVRPSGEAGWRLARLQRLGPSLAVVECPIELQTGDLLQIDLTSEGMWRPLNGRVRAARPTSIRNRCEAELQLVDLEPAEQERINRFLFNTALPSFLDGFVDAQTEGPPPDAVVVERWTDRAPLAAYTPPPLLAVGQGRAPSGSESRPTKYPHRAVALQMPVNGYPVLSSRGTAEPRPERPRVWINPLALEMRRQRVGHEIGRVSYEQPAEESLRPDLESLLLDYLDHEEPGN